MSRKGLRRVAAAAGLVLALAGTVGAQSAWAPEDLAIGFGGPNGTWILSSTTWAPLHDLSPLAMVTGDIDGNGSDDLVLNFGPGIGVWAWMNHAAWTFIHPQSPSQMVTRDLDHDGKRDVVLVFPGNGVWLWSNGTWTQLHGLDASRLAIGQIDGLPGDDLVVDFPGYGLWILANNKTWKALNSLHAAALLTADLDGNGRDEVVVDFGPPYGLWVYRNGTTWSQLHAVSPARIATGDIDGDGRADLVMDLGAPYGVWTFRNDQNWVLLHSLPTEDIVLVDRDGTGSDEVVIDFGPALGLWQYANDGEWSQLHPMSPERIVRGRFHSLPSLRVVSFGGLTVNTLFNAPYTESGVTVEPVSGNWRVNGYGAPHPAVVFSGFDYQGAEVSASIQVTSGGTPFTFAEVSLYSSVTAIPWRFTGYLGLQEVFSVSGQQSNTFGNFVTVANPAQTAIIDRLIITLTQPVNTTCPTCGGNPMGLDNISIR